MPANFIRGKLFLYLSIFAFITFVIVSACRKIDHRHEEITIEQKESDFFNRHLSNDPLVLDVIGFVKRQNGKYHFTENLIKKIGYPYWNGSIVINGAKIGNAKMFLIITGL